MTEPRCPFCGHDPFYYVHNGVGMEAVAVNCCDFGIVLYSRNYAKERKVLQRVLRLRSSYSPRKKARARRLLESLWAA